MSFSFLDPRTGKRFKVEGPPGFTEAQARRVFDQQLKAGSLVDLKPGQIVDAAQQAVNGLSSALSEVAQAASSTVTGAVGRLGTAAQSLKNITEKSLTGVATQGINPANFAKQIPAVANIDRLSVPDVTASLAQAGKLVNQAATSVSNNLGVGKFGLDAAQLESAGVLKPGTASSFLSAGATNLTDVLKSPTVWTGKDGIKGVNDLLSSLPTQNGIQQQLMSNGLNGLSQLGVPIDKLSPQSLAGAALNAAKSIEGAFAWATGAALPTDLSSAFDSVAKNAQFAVGLSKTKINDAMKGIKSAEPAEDTVQRATVDAAATRVIDNEKVPPIEYSVSTPPVALEALREELKVQEARKDRVSFFIQGRTAVVSENRDNLDRLLAVLTDLDLIESGALDIIGKLKDIQQRARAVVPPDTSISERASFLIKVLEIDIGLVDLLRDNVNQIIEDLRAQTNG